MLKNESLATNLLLGGVPLCQFGKEWMVFMHMDMHKKKSEVKFFGLPSIFIKCQKCDFELMYLDRLPMERL